VAAQTSPIGHLAARLRFEACVCLRYASPAAL